MTKQELITSKSPELPLFFQSWWLDIVCQNGSWAYCTAQNKEGEITGLLPYYQTKLYGFPIIKMPPLTPFLGAWIFYPNHSQKNHQRYSFEQRILDELFTQLPKVKYYIQNCHPQFQDWLPLHWMHYKQTTRYTYQLTDLSNHQKLFQNFKETLRNKIRKGERQLSIEKTEDLSLFYEINKLAFQGKKPVIPYSLALFQRLDEALKNKNQRNIYLAKTRNHEIVAGLYLVWDHETAYVLASGMKPNAGSMGAMPVLIWRAIQDMSKQVNIFDFEGSMLQGVEPFFRSFGGIRRPYLQLYKGENKWWEVLRVIMSK